MQTHRPRKRFGQHFLRDPEVISHIVEAIHPLPEDLLVEIGPGQGALTLALIPKVKAMNAIEIDRDLIATLSHRAAALGVLHLHTADALTFDYKTLAHPLRLLRVVGNLPYNVSTPLLFHLLEYVDVIQDMHFMLQKEVVERMAAQSGEKAYGRLSVMLQYHCAVQALFTVPPEAFYPPPQVESAIVRLIPHRPLPYPCQDFTVFSDVVRHVFGQRRKTLRNGLKIFLSSEEWQQIAIDPSLRPEMLGVGDFVKISNFIVSRSQDR